jgi:hypothetical protein
MQVNRVVSPAALAASLAWVTVGSFGSPTQLLPTSDSTLPVGSSNNIIQFVAIVNAGLNGNLSNGTPQVAAGSRNGQLLLLVGTDDTNYWELVNGTGLSLRSAMNLGQNNILCLCWDGTLWREVSRG